MREIKVGDKVAVKTGCETGVSTPYFNSNMKKYEGTTQVVSEIVAGKGWVKLNGVRSDGCDWTWSPKWLKLEVEMSKEEWINGLLEGKIGIQSGNTRQRWKYSNGYFQSKCEGNWQKDNINDVYVTREFSFDTTTEMSIAEIEKALGVTNLKIIK